MRYFWLFLLFAAGMTALCGLLGGAWWLCVLIFVISFLFAHLVFLLVLRLLTRHNDLSQPDAKQNPYARAAIPPASRCLCFYAGMRPHIRGTEKLPETGRFLYVSNHRSMFDPLMVMAYLGKWNIAFISKPSNLAIPLAGPIVSAAGYLAIDRENDRNALRTILTAADFMKRDLCSIGVYPEGTRSHDGKLLPFHKGTFKMAQRANVPLAIACVRGTEKLKNGIFLHPHTVYLDILEVLPAERVKAMSTQELADYARDRIQECLEGGEA